MKARGSKERHRLGSRRVISGPVVASSATAIPLPLQPPAFVTPNQYCIPPPPRTALARHHGPTIPFACRKATTHPIWTALWQQHACHQRGQSEGGKPAAGCKLCMPTLPSPASRRPCGQWAAAPGRLAAGESLCWGDCTSITSPKPSLPLSNHQPRSNRRPHRVALDQPASRPLCTSHSIAPGCLAHVFPGPC